MSEEYVVLGSIGSTFGVKGWLKVNSYTRPYTNILDYPFWYLSGDHNTWHKVEVLEVKEQGGKIVAKLSSASDIDTAKLLTGLKIAVQKEQLPQAEDNEYYWHELNGFMLEDLTGNSLGMVTGLDNFGASDVFEVETIDGKKVYIPYVAGQVVKEVLAAQRKIIVDWDLEYNAN